MKTISFFTEKGGVGKTTLTTMFASWLAYDQKQKVIAMDFDNPSYQLYNARNNDMNIYKRALTTTNILSENNPDAPQQGALRNLCNQQLIRFVGQNIPYPIYKTKYTDSRQNYDYISRTILNNKNDPSYFIMDFPGHFLQGDNIVEMSKNGLIDLIVFIADSDRQTRTSIMNVYKVMGKFNQKCVLLWNRETKNERLSESTGRRDWYTEATRQFETMGIPVLTTRVRDLPVTRRDADNPQFVRNTLCWPISNIKRFCPYMETIFIDIRKLLDEN